MKEMCTPMINVLGVTSDVPLTHKVINESLTHLMNMQTSLRMCMRRNDDVLHFCKMEVDALSKIQAEVRNDTDWSSVVDENRWGDIFDPEKGPLWKCIFLPNAKMSNDTEEDLSRYNCIVIFVQDHSINDGVGTVEMMKNFMFVLNQLLSENEVITNLSPPQLPVEYFLHQKYPLSSFQRGLKLFLQTLISFRCMASLMVWMMSKLTKNIFGQLVGLEEDRNPHCVKSTKSHLQILMREKTKTLVQSCKNNGCTVQGAIQAASNVALLHILHAHGAKLPLNLVNYVPIDMRRRILQNPTGYPGTLYAGGINTELEVEEGVLKLDIKYLWKLARDSTNTVRAEIEQKQYLRRHFDMYSMSVFFEKHFDLTTKFSAVGRTAAPVLLVASSLGRFSFSESSKNLAKPSGFLFSLTAMAGGPIFATYVATLDDQLSISHSYYPHVTSESLSMQYCSKFREILEHFVKNDQKSDVNPNDLTVGFGGEPTQTKQ